jgi:hypothetical protein
VYGHGRLSADLPTAPAHGIEKARKDVRDFLRALPAHCSYQSAAKTDWIRAWSAAEGELKTLEKAVLSHDFNFRDGTEYKLIFDLAACGMRGWRSRPS